MTRIVAGDWVLVCETNERGCVIEVFDDGERFLLSIPLTDGWPYPKRVHVMVEKIRKIRPPKEKKVRKIELTWKQACLFEEKK